MSTELEELLREGMERYTTGVRAPEGLARAAVRRRRRRTRTGLTATGVVAAAVLLAVVAVYAGAPPPTPPARVAQGTVTPTAARLVADVETALASVSRGGDVVAARMDTMPGVGLSWTTPGRNATELRDGAGRLVAAAGYRSSHGVVSVVFVNYRDRSWFRVQLPAGRPGRSPLPAVVAPLGVVLQIERQFGTHGCDARQPSGGSIVERVITFRWPDFIREMLACGAFSVTGHARVDGVNAVVVVSAKPARLTPVSEVLWVDPKDHLPLRMAIVGRGQYLRTDFRWLPPTPANVAHTRVAIPPGFHQEPPPGS